MIFLCKKCNVPFTDKQVYYEHSCTHNEQIAEALEFLRENFNHLPPDEPVTREELHQTLMVVLESLKKEVD